MRYILLIILISSIGFTVSGQLPVTEIFLLELQDNDRIAEVSYLTGFNTDSYNNQAVFIGDNEVILTSELEDEQTDIVKLNLLARTWKRLTATEESEYSPRTIDEANFTVVRVEKDGETQTLWEYPLSLTYNGEQILKESGQVGYYQFLPNLKVALFVIEKSMNLYIGDMRRGTTAKKDEGIGRCFQVSKTGELWYISKPSDDSKGKIKTYNTVNQRITSVATVLGDSQDFCLYGNTEKVIMAQNAQLFMYDQPSDTWILWIDLSEYGVKKITRLDCRDNKILLTNIPN